MITKDKDSKKFRDPFYSYLEEAFLERRKKNPSYSLRAFARFLNVDQSSLSKAFKGKRTFSHETIKSILQTLKTSSDVIEILERELINRVSSSRELTEQEVISLCDWKFWAILEAIKIDRTFDMEEMSSRLGIAEKELKSKLNRLEQLGFIAKDKKYYKLLKPNNTWINTERTSDARKKLQEQYLKKSLVALKSVPFTHRDHSSLTVAIDKKRLPELRKKIAKFHKELGDFGQKKGTLDEVYQLTISLFPLSKGEFK